MIDTHSHLNFDIFRGDYKKIIKDCSKKGISIINVGINYKTSLKAIKIAKKYENIYATIGLHPLYIKQEKYDYQKYIELVKNKKIIAIGEIGLDYGYNINNKDYQKEILLKQINLAQKFNLPIIFHCRKAHDDLYEIVNPKLKISNSKQISNFNDQNLKPKGVIHCFTGTWNQAQRYLEIGFYLGFNGIIFKLNLDEVIKKIPIDRILFETDCPYLTPPELGKIRNNPQFIIKIVKKVAEIKKIDVAELIKITDQNAKRLFGI